MKKYAWPLTFSLLLIILVACEKNIKEPGYEVKILNDMVYPVPYEAFGESDSFDKGQVLKKSVKGTIPRGFQPLHYEKGEQGAMLAGQELKNPVIVSSEVLARGKEMYAVFCQVCHGVQGLGDGPLIPKFPNPPSFNSKRIREMPDGRIFHVITRGGSIMPPHDTQIEPEDRWKIIHYIRLLQQGENK